VGVQEEKHRDQEEEARLNQHTVFVSQWFFA